MNDPHVERLQYRISSGEGISYENPAPVNVTNPLGTFTSQGGKLTVVPAAHFADEQAAQLAITPFLKAWEVHADLASNVGTIRFQFERAEIIDHNPPPPGSPQTLRVRGAISGMALIDAVKVQLVSKKYPDPPAAFHFTAEVEWAYGRWRAYLDTREPLQAAAYFVLTMLEEAAVRLHGNRNRKLDGAAKLYAIDSDVLRKVSELSTIRGNERTARKAGSGGVFKDLSGSEKAWLEQAMRRMVQRLGEQASGASLTQITMADFPKL